MLNVTKGSVLCFSPEMLELRDTLQSFFDADRIKIRAKQNNVNSIHITIDLTNLDKFAKKLELHGHRLLPTDTDGIRVLILKSGTHFDVICSEKFILLVNL